VLLSCVKLVCLEYGVMCIDMCVILQLSVEPFLLEISQCRVLCKPENTDRSSAEDTKLHRISAHLMTAE
jgi:hypothetical protein